MMRKRIAAAVATLLFIVFSTVVFAACGESETQAVLERLEISGSFKTRYVAESDGAFVFDRKGMKVYACYSDGTRIALDDGDYELTVDGTTWIQVSYGGKTAVRGITVGTAADARSEADVKQEFAANKSVFSDVENNFELKYCFREPDNASETEKVPLVLFLHGAGERGDDNESQLKACIAKAYQRFDSMFYDSYVLAPQCPYVDYATGEVYDSDTAHMNINASKWVNRHWTEGSYRLSETAETPALKAAAKLVRETLQNPYVDASRVYVVGLSMGGYGTWDIIARYPELFAAAVPICGGGPLDKARELADLPIYAFHGTADTAVPFVAGTKRMYEEISRFGKNKMLFRPFENGGHSIWDQAITYAGDDVLPATIDWLFAQNKE